MKITIYCWSTSEELGDWQGALDFNRQIRESEHKRAAALEITTASVFRDFLPLLRLGRLDEADQVARTCEAMLKGHEDTAVFGRVLRARADIEGHRGRYAEALNLGQHAFHHAYTLPETPADVAMGHFNYFLHLDKAGGDPVEVIAHIVAAAMLLFTQGRSDHRRTAVATLAEWFRVHPDQNLAASLDNTVDLVERVPGVQFRRLLSDLHPDSGDREDIHAELLATARALAVTSL